MSHNHPKRRTGLGRMLGLGLGLTIALLANFGDRAFMASSDNSGIDPLQILDTEVKNNILFVVSTSETLAGTRQNAGAVVGGDDPASRLYQVKRALRDVIAENQGKANFGIATFHPEAAEHAINDANGLVYVTQDPTGNNYRNEFDRSGGSVIGINLGVSGAFTANCDPCTTLAYAPPAGSLLIAFVVDGAGQTEPVVSGHGLASYGAAIVGVGMSGGETMYVYAAKAGAAPTSTGVSANFPGSSRPRSIVEYYITGADVSGTAAAAIAQFDRNANTGSTASVTLAASADPTRNAAMFFVAHGIAEGTGHNLAGGWTEGTDFTLDIGGTGSDVGVETQFRLAFATAASATFTSSDWAAIALEIKAAPIPPLVDSCGGGACSAAQSSGIFDLLLSTDAGTANKYPAVCTDQLLDQVAVGGAANAPIPHVLNTNCRYYVRSKVMLNGKRYTINRSAVPTATITASADNITCPAPPPGLLGDDSLAANDGTKNRACFQLVDATPLVGLNKITTYWLSGTQFNYAGVTTPSASPRQCNESDINVDVAECNGADNTTALQALTRLELQYDNVSGLPVGVPSLTNVGGLKPGNPAFTDVGIRTGTGSPITQALTFALKYFRSAVLTPGGSAKRPLEAQGKQKQFVVLIVDKDPDGTCDTLAEAQAAAYALWTNTLPSLPSCSGSCGVYGDVTAAGWAAANRIELVVVPFGGTQAVMDAISKAGTGLPPTPAGNTVCSFGGICRGAPIASDLTGLSTALKNAVFSGTGTGTFSDQQSVTETVFEFSSLGTPSKDPLDPFERYAVAIPVLLQSTFEMPDFKGHLNAVIRNNAGTSSNPDDDFQEVKWDAGAKLYNRVATGAGLPTGSTGMGTAAFTFTQLYGNADPPTVQIKTSTAKIKRRIYTTLRNGVNQNYDVGNLLNANFGNLAGDLTLGIRRVAMWPPTKGDGNLAFVAPTTTGSTATPKRGILDAAMGLEALGTVALVQAAVPGACQATVGGTVPNTECTSLTAGVALSRARREAREIILAYIAGARVRTLNGVPVRSTLAPIGEILYEVRPWIMVESTLASPGVVTPPLLAGPEKGDLGEEEYKFYRDGIRNSSTLAPINGVLNGVGLRNPDRVDSSASQAVIDAAYANLDIKPSMSVVYHSTNQGLHAFRAGPCPNAPAGSGISAGTIPCAGESGGEELWAFIPYDVLYKLPALTIPQTRATKQYLLAAPVRFSDVFVPGPGTDTFGGETFTGVWRVLLYFGRGQGGKYLTALDVTTPGPFTRHSLDTTEPIVVWSRGNPDTTLGLPCATGVDNNTPEDCTAYEKMGETWSVPAMGYIDKANYTTARKPGGTDFALFVGSGYSDVPTEGKTFFVLDALNGDVIQNFDIPDNGSVPALTPPLTNFLVASPVSYQENADGNSPAGFKFQGNPLSTKTSKVYFPDLHGRIWLYDALQPGDKPQIFFEADVATDGNQPFPTAVSVQQYRPDTAIPGEIMVYAEAGHDRRVPTDVDKPFKAYAIKDTGLPGTLIFTKDFPKEYRGTVQPASAFAQDDAGLLTPVVFYAGIKYNAGCVPTFDSILMALKALNPLTPTTPLAAFDLSATGDDSFIEIAGSKIQAIRVSGEGSLVIDQGLSAQNVPPPPGVPVPTVPIPGSGGLVRQGLTPMTKEYQDLVATTQPYRIGSSVCKAQ